MRILVLGSGAREHALAWKLSKNQTSPMSSAPRQRRDRAKCRDRAVDVLDTDAVIRFVDREQSI